MLTRLSDLGFSISY